MSQKKLKDKTGNQINTIYPYRTKSGWSFDDPEVGLEGEPFVAGVPEIIDMLVNGANSFTAHISHSPIPGYQCHLRQTAPPEGFQNDPGWYEMVGTDMVGWLCPATLKYFPTYPKDIYVTIEKKKA